MKLHCLLGTAGRDCKHYCTLGDITKDIFRGNCDRNIVTGVVCGETVECHEYRVIKEVEPSKRSLNEAMDDRARGRRAAYKRVLELIAARCRGLSNVCVSTSAAAREMQEVHVIMERWLKEEKGEEGAKTYQYPIHPVSEMKFRADVTANLTMLATGIEQILKLIVEKNEKEEKNGQG